MRSAILVAAAVLVSLAAEGEARAEPQGTVGLTIGGAGRGDGGSWLEEPAFHLGMRGDVLFGRESTSDFGIGPYAELMTLAFDDVQIGGGASLLVPVFDAVPLVASFGPYGRAGEGDFGFEPGLATSLFFGSRSYNFSSGYVLAAGVLVQGRVGLGDSEERSLVIAAQIDGALLAMPFLLLGEALFGGSREVDPVR